MHHKTSHVFHLLLLLPFLLLLPLSHAQQQPLLLRGGLHSHHANMESRGLRLALRTVHVALQK